IQVRYFFEYVDRVKKREKILSSLKETILPVAVGEVTEEHLKDQGIEHVLTPTTPRMGAMVMEMAKYYRKLESS
ncbi:uroporphyrinogen-III synthase, partial [Pseudalkalibacillus hwajinpoensis]